MTNHAIDPTYLAYQYANSEKLRIRIEAHERYSEASDDFTTWVLDRLDPQPGELIADVGCGPGTYHADLALRGVHVLGIDASLGMVQEAQKQAASQKRPIRLVQSNAEYLPLSDTCCDRLMANHMLYHVPDQQAALREMHRVLVPGGRVVLTTNAADQNERLRHLHAEASSELGYTPGEESMSARFTLDHLSLVQIVFSNARVEIRRDAFLFPTPDAVLSYYASAHIDAIVDRPADNSHRPRLLALMARKVQAIIEQEGIFRVPKDAGCFVGDKER